MLRLSLSLSSLDPNVASFGTVYILYIRSLLEQSATVWHTSLKEENTSELEGIQKSAVKVILGN